MALSLNQLANFLRIVELGSLSKAAAVIRIAQPALSRQVRTMEAEFGAPLLTRHGRGVTPTTAGEILAAHARRLLREVEILRDQVSASAAEPSGRVGLGVPTSLAGALLPPLAAALRQRHPALRPHFVDGFSAVLHERTLAGDLDLAVLYLDRPMGPLAASPLIEEELLLVGAAGSAAMTRAEAPDLAGLPLILPGRPNRLRLIVDQALSVRAPQLAAEVDSLPAMIEMVRAGQGCTVLPYSTVAAEVERGALVARPIAGVRLSRTLSLARPLDREPTAATAAVEREIRTLVRSEAARLRWRPLGEEGTASTAP